jgi:hypothetical protein
MPNWCHASDVGPVKLPALMVPELQHIKTLLSLPQKIMVSYEFVLIFVDVYVPYWLSSSQCTGKNVLCEFRPMLMRYFPFQAELVIKVAHFRHLLFSRYCCTRFRNFYETLKVWI